MQTVGVHPMGTNTDLSIVRDFWLLWLNPSTVARKWDAGVFERTAKFSLGSFSFSRLQGKYPCLFPSLPMQNLILKRGGRDIEPYEWNMYFVILYTYVISRIWVQKVGTQWHAVFCSQFTWQDNVSGRLMVKPRNALESCLQTCIFLWSIDFQDYRLTLLNICQNSLEWMSWTSWNLFSACENKRNKFI